MKFWQLMSIMRGESDLVIQVAATRDDWRQYGLWAADEAALVSAQHRDILDRLVDAEFVQAVLVQSRKRLFVTADGTLRVRKSGPSDRELAVADAVASYGGGAVEDAYEYGSYRPESHPIAKPHVPGRSGLFGSPAAWIITVVLIGLAALVAWNVTHS